MATNVPAPSPVRGDVDPDASNSGATESGSPVSTNERLLRQIEVSADFYDPRKYESLLTYYNDLDLQPEGGLSLDYIGLTAVKTNPKMFVVGILPPTMNITGRLLDRSASAAVITDPLPVRAYDEGNPRLVLQDGQLVEDASGNATENGENTQNTHSWGGAAKDLPHYFWVEWVTMCGRLGIDPVELAAVCYNESGFNPGAVNTDSNAKGLFQFMPSIARKYMSDEEFATFENLPASEQLPYFERFLEGGRPRWAGRSPTASGVASQRVGAYRHVFGGLSGANLHGEWYISREAQQRNVASMQATVSDLRARAAAATDPAERDALLAEAYRTEDRISKAYPTGRDGWLNDRAYRQNRGFDKNNDGAITSDDIWRSISGKPPLWIQQTIRDIQASGEKAEYEGSLGTQLRPMWVEDGSPEADLVRKLLSQVGQTGYNATPNGIKFLEKQKAMIAQAQLKLDNMRNTPPLKMRVNPASFTVKGEKIVSDGNWSRNGPVIEHWGDAQDKISGSGKVAGFYSMYRNDARMPGLTRTAKFFSESFQNFLSLFLIYRNNGGLYLQDKQGDAIRQNLSVVGTVYIYYDNTLYLGSFDSFNMTEDATAPHNLEYSFEFTVRAAFLLDRPNEQGFTYGAPNLFPSEQAPLLQTTSRGLGGR
jgi:hypothetical protein